MSEIVKFRAGEDLAEQYGLPFESFVSTVRAVAMPPQHTLGELMSCLIVAREHGLNPLTKEIYFMKTKGGSIHPIVSVDGWMRKCNEHPQFDGVEFEERMDGGKIVAMTCRMFRKDRGHPISVTEYLDECTTGGGPVWKTHPKRMLRNRTYCQAARMAFGFAGIMEPEEFQQWQNNPELQEPIALEASDEPLTARDGGKLPRSMRDRPAATAFKEIGGPDKYNALISDIEDCTDIAGLHACFDAFERHGQPWAEFPSGYAKLIQDHYHYRIKDLAEAAPNEQEDEPLADQDGLVTAIEEALAAATCKTDIDEIIEGNADLVQRCSADNRRRIAELYAGASA